jgi:hypothetical protein
MTDRSPIFNSFRRAEAADPHPHALTEEERALVMDRMASGSAPPFRLVRKLLRLSDERRTIALEQQARIDAALEILREPGMWSDFAQRATKALKGDTP